jgi:hypothetical protein
MTRYSEDSSRAGIVATIFVTASKIEKHDSK